MNAQAKAKRAPREPAGASTTLSLNKELRLKIAVEVRSTTTRGSRTPLGFSRLGLYTGQRRIAFTNVREHSSTYRDSQALLPGRSVVAHRN